MPRIPQQGQTEQPATFAEGVPVPTNVPATPAEAAKAAGRAPTKADYDREHGTYVATTDLMWGSSLAVQAGGRVPASHPGLRDSDERGPGWVSNGDVELTGDYDAPADLAGVHQAADAQQAQGSSPGAGLHPGASA